MSGGNLSLLPVGELSHLSPKKKTKNANRVKVPPTLNAAKQPSKWVALPKSANRLNDRIGSTIDSLNIPMVELGLPYAVGRVGAVENIENINVATFSYSLRKIIIIKIG